MPWYALQVQPHAEHATARRLGEFAESYVPEAKAETVHAGRVVAETVPAFPCYVLCDLEPTAQAWHEAAAVKGVIRLLGGEEPQPLRRGEVQTIRQRELAGELASPRLRWPRIGSSVRIKFGHLVNRIGTLTETRRNRVVVEMDCGGRMIAIHLPVRAIESAEPTPINKRGNRGRPKYNRGASRSCSAGSFGSGLEAV